MPLGSGRLKDPAWQEVSKQVDGSYICNHCKQSVLGKGTWAKIERVKNHLKKCPSKPKATVSSSDAEKLEDLAVTIDEENGFTSSEDTLVFSPTPSTSGSRSLTPTAGPALNLKRSRQSSGIYKKKLTF